MIALAHTKVSREALYAATGIQTMPINTVFQLMAEGDGPAMRWPSARPSCRTCSACG